MDRIAIISDIHGNIPALETVLSDIRDRGIHRIICLGDVVGKGPDPDIAVDRVKESCEMVLKGNWDHIVSDRKNHKVLSWQRNKLGSERLIYLSELPLYTEFYFSGRLIRLCHASPEDVFYRIQSAASYEEKSNLFMPPNGKSKEADVIGYGDIHSAYVQSFDGKMIFNAGSVGNPLEITQASYGIIEGTQGTMEKLGLSVTLVRVPYDIEKAVKDAVDSGMPELGAYVHELRTARYRGMKKVNGKWCYNAKWAEGEEK